MSGEEIAAKFQDLGLLVSPDALDLVSNSKYWEDILREISNLQDKPFVIEKELVETIEKKITESKMPSAEVVVQRASDYKPLAAEQESDLKVFDKYDVTGKSRCTGKVDDFVDYFRDRFKKSKNVLKTHMSEYGVIPLSQVAGFARGKKARLIGMIYEKRVTKNGHVMMTLEDEEATVNCLILKDEKEAIKKADWLITDDVVALDGVTGGNFFIVKDITWPDIPMRQKRTADTDLSVAFISDIHVGSRFFMQKQFENFIAWINGKYGDKRQQELAGKVKYVLVCGDVVDGVGVYPSQDKELSIKDIYNQYAGFAKYMLDIPEYIEIVICPGNHDAVRRADPQPKLTDELVPQLQGMSNIHLTGSPSLTQIHDLYFMLYHGMSLGSVIGSLPGLSYMNPEKPAVEMLKRRSLCPVYGGVSSIVPEERDYLFIDVVPDVMHMGHVHKNGYENYKGTVVVNSGCFQAVTDFQIRQGHIPDPGFVPVYDLRSASVNVMRFAGP